MSNKDRPLVGCHVQKNGVCWLMNDREGRSAASATPIQRRTRRGLLWRPGPIHGSGQLVVTRMLHHYAIEAWETMQKSGGWKRCPPKW
ncbi:hypothetical protein [Synechococcus sp. WH 8020]|uniref:hypothetical protein n=1 Tax=Synechococcus sp. (strain WH8020) TaxID=32052 RepID=UPI0012EEDA5F|nr:hypothetical protein [Synechococcus sp. WH 8020]